VGAESLGFLIRQNVEVASLRIVGIVGASAPIMFGGSVNANLLSATTFISGDCEGVLHGVGVHFKS